MAQNELLRDLESELLLFGKIIMPSTFWAESPAVHYDIESILLDPEKLKVNLILPRGTAKTTLAGEVKPMHHIFVENQGSPKFVVIVSKTQSHSKDRLRKIKDVITDSAQFKAIFGEWGESTAIASRAFPTFGFPEPEIFGFFYVHPGGVASVGIFFPLWFDCPTRTVYRYLQHYIQHPYLWRYLEGGKLRSWGAKSLQESGKRGEPFLVGDGYARIGESSGSTNVLTGSGVDEAWTSGVQLAEGVLELLRAGKPFTRENLAQAYEARRRASWLEREARIAEKSRDGFQRGVVTDRKSTR